MFLGILIESSNEFLGKVQFRGAASCFERDLFLARFAFGLLSVGSVIIAILSFK
jgi:hypothetical protein